MFSVDIDTELSVNAVCGYEFAEIGSRQLQSRALVGFHQDVTRLSLLNLAGFSADKAILIANRCMAFLL